MAQPTIPEADLTFDYIKSKIRSNFPGVKLEVGRQVGGQQVRFWVWQFLIEVSFCEEKVAVVDSTGSARVTFKFQPDPKKRPIFTKTTSVKNPTSFEQFLVWVLAYLNGITAALDQAMTGEHLEIADIFRGDDSR